MTDIVWGWGGVKVIRVEIRLILVIFACLAVVGGYSVWVVGMLWGVKTKETDALLILVITWDGKSIPYIFYALWAL